MPTYASLQELQELDAQIDRATSRIEGFDPLLEELESSARELEARIERTRTRLTELRVAERRLERTAEEKRNRLRMLRDRLLKVHNLRQEAAVRAEMDLLNRSVDGDEQEALAHLDQIRKREEEAERLEGERREEREKAGPRRREIERERREVESSLAALRTRREACAAGLDGAGARGVRGSAVQPQGRDRPTHHRGWSVRAVFLRGPAAGPGGGQRRPHSAAMRGVRDHLRAPGRRILGGGPGGGAAVLRTVSVKPSIVLAVSPGTLHAARSTVACAPRVILIECARHSSQSPIRGGVKRWRPIAPPLPAGGSDGSLRRWPCWPQPPVPTTR